MNKYVRMAAMFTLGFSLMLAGCGSSTGKDVAQSHQHHAPNGDLQETTASLDQLPSFLEPLSEQVRTAYKTAATVTDQLQYIPCYCGCGESAGHENNLNCFIKEINEDGVVWDDHGTRCGVCLEIALITAELDKQGTSLLDIRHAIDGMYAEGYAVPTPTPMPEA